MSIVGDVRNPSQSGILNGTSKGDNMKDKAFITIISNRRKEKIPRDKVFYVQSRRNYSEIHVCEAEYKIYKTLMTLEEIETVLGKGFVKVQRGCLVSEMAIERIADKIYLVNGEELKYTVRNKKEIVEKLRSNSKLQIHKPARGVYQIMNPGVFATVKMISFDATNEDAGNGREEDFVSEQVNAPNTQERYLKVIFDKKEYLIDINAIVYITIKKNIAQIHTQRENLYYARMTLKKLKEQLGDDFLLIHKNTLVAAKAIHEISDKVYLSNGEALHYVARKKKAMRSQLLEMQKKLLSSFDGDDVPKTYQEYRSYYGAFEHLPFAFADIEMVLNEEFHAVDWIFRYGNQALAKLEKLPLEALIDSSFGTLFSNMDSKWLRSYEQAALYGEKLEIVDYSPEIDTYLKVICFPTFKGHCGCILFNIDEIKFTRNSEDAEKALKLYFDK